MRMHLREQNQEDIGRTCEDHNAATSPAQLQKVDLIVQKMLCPSMNNRQESKPLAIEGQALVPILSIPELED